MALEIEVLPVWRAPVIKTTLFAGGLGSKRPKNLPICKISPMIVNITAKFEIFQAEQREGNQNR
jgi:hypothetical protein